jgi:hypothetical protein
MGRLGKEGLIHYAWGEVAAPVERKKDPWYYRLGLRDTKRWVLLLVILFYVSGLSVALSMRHPVLVRLSPERDVLYRLGDDGEVYNRFRASVSNRSGEKAFVVLSIQDLRGARLVAPSEASISVEPDETVEHTFEVEAYPGGPSPGVNHFRFVSRTMPDGTTNTFDMTFIMPPKEN